MHKENCKRGWQKSFAERAGITQSSLSKIISGETADPGLTTVSAIMDALGIELTTSGLEYQKQCDSRELIEAREKIRELEKSLHVAEGRAQAFQEVIRLQNMTMEHMPQEKRSIS